MTDILTGMLSEEEFLEHHGVKGMKWGVLRDKAAAGSKGAARKLAKEDVKWNKEVHGMKGWIKVNNAVADKMNGPGGLIDKHNNNPKYKGADFNNWRDPITKKYFDDFEKISLKTWQDTTRELYGSSPSGRYTIEAKLDKPGNAYLEVVDTQQIQHADTEAQLRFYLELDPNTGQILAIKKDGDTITHQGMLSEEEFLEHFGVKGMKWGKRSPQHPDYTNDQAKRDRQVYGTRGAKRVNKSLHAGNKISVARGDEKTRRDAVMGKNKYVRQGGKIAGAAVGAVGGFLGGRALAKSAASQAGQKAINKLFGSNGPLVSSLLGSPAVSFAAAAGAAKIATMFAGDLAVSANMRANGYDPNRK